MEQGQPDTAVAFPGGRGTAGMVELARGAGVRVVQGWSTGDPTTRDRQQYPNNGGTPDDRNNAPTAQAVAHSLRSSGGRQPTGLHAQGYMPPNAADQENYARENSNPENQNPEEVNPMTTKDTLKPQINPTLNMILKRVKNAADTPAQTQRHKHPPPAPLLPRTVPRKSPQGRHRAQFQHPRSLLHYQLPLPERSINDHRSAEPGKTLRSTHHQKAAPEEELRTSQDSPPDGRTHPKSERAQSARTGNGPLPNGKCRGAITRPDNPEGGTKPQRLLR